MKVLNRKAKFNYELLDRYEAGLVLTGAEVKSAKLGAVSLADAFVKFTEGELWLTNAHINPYKFADNTEYDPLRSRKLLLTSSEILKIRQAIETKNLNLVPTALYTKHRKVKLEIALARGKKQFQKKEKKKRQDLEREQERTLKKFK